MLVLEGNAFYEIDEDCVKKKLEETIVKSRRKNRDSVEKSIANPIKADLRKDNIKNKGKE